MADWTSWPDANLSQLAHHYAYELGSVLLPSADDPGYRVVDGELRIRIAPNGEFVNLTIEVPGGDRCSGLAATWCQIHGDCSCERDEDDGNIKFSALRGCPLHGMDSKHANNGG